MRFSNKGSTASGVRSRPVKPVPPVVMMTSTAGSAIQPLMRSRMASTSSRTMARALLRPSLGTGVGHNATLTPPLQRSGADRGRGPQGGLDVPRFDERRFPLGPETFVLAVRPYAGEAVCLQLHLHLNVIGTGFA